MPVAPVGATGGKKIEISIIKMHCGPYFWQNKKTRQKHGKYENMA